MRSEVRPGGGGWGGRPFKERGDTGAARKAGGRGTDKKTYVRRPRHKHAVLHSCEPGQGGWTVLL